MGLFILNKMLQNSFAKQAGIIGMHRRILSVDLAHLITELLQVELPHFFICIFPELFKIKIKIFQDSNLE